MCTAKGCTDSLFVCCLLYRQIIVVRIFCAVVLNSTVVVLYWIVLLYLMFKMKHCLQLVTDATACYCHPRFSDQRQMEVAHAMQIQVQLLQAQLQAQATQLHRRLAFDTAQVGGAGGCLAGRWGGGRAPGRAQARSKGGWPCCIRGWKRPGRVHGGIWWSAWVHRVGWRHWCFLALVLFLWCHS